MGDRIVFCLFLKGDRIRVSLKGRIRVKPTQFIILVYNAMVLILDGRIIRGAHEEGNL